MARKKGGSKRAEEKKESLKEKIERITQEQLKKVEETAKKRAEKADKLLKGVDRIVMPEEARKKASEEKEAGGKLDIYRVERGGEKIAIVKPRIKEEYTKERGEAEVKFDLDKMEEIRPFQFKETEETGVGTVHTHPGSSSELSKADKENAALSGAPVLAVSDKEKQGHMAYLTSNGKLKQEKVDSVPSKKIKELLEK